MVHFLRHLLHRHGLDTVYGGGLNSYRLYALVLSFLRVYIITVDESNDVGEALLFFLEYHGRRRNGLLTSIDRRSLFIECPELLDGVTMGPANALSETVIGFAPCHRLNDVAHVFRTTATVLRTRKDGEHDFVTQRTLSLDRMVKGTCRAVIL
tara:strand:- start:110 stop:568 length:459 start_codon:yes stop_codon:yes gene_type:complete